MERNPTMNRIAFQPALTASRQNKLTQPKFSGEQHFTATKITAEAIHQDLLAELEQTGGNTDSVSLSANGGQFTLRTDDADDATAKYWIAFHTEPETAD